MKIIHCADLHLDSKMDSNLSKTDAKSRKREILNTFIRMVEYAASNGVKAILIAGDLFDTKNVTLLARNTFKDLVIRHPEIGFYYLRGNHDDETSLDVFDEIPDNLYLFDKEWKEYRIGEKTAIYGVELNSGNSLQVQTAFAPDPSLINIVMLHGQDVEAACVEKAETINIKQFRNKGINYLALGHIHGYRVAELDGEGKYCYCGCLEGRGFDETGDHGFVLLDINEETQTVTDTFVSFAKRRLYEVKADVTGLNNTPDMLSAVKEALRVSDASADDLIKVVLCGDVDVECEKDTEFIRHSINDGYYFVKVYDKTKLKIDPRQFLLDTSLKGEFVRSVLDSDLSEEEKGEVVRIGLNVLMGGKVEL